MRARRSRFGRSVVSSLPDLGTFLARFQGGIPLTCCLSKLFGSFCGERFDFLSHAFQLLLVFRGLPFAWPVFGVLRRIVDSPCLCALPPSLTREPLSRPLR